MNACPIAQPDRRLRDAFTHWRGMEENYFDPNRFRLNLNSFIQEARNVTFILQKKKSELPGFEGWYSGWQEKLKADPILRWIVESRNRITKQGDLEIKSECNIVFTTDWTDELTRRFKGNPLVPSSILAKQVLAQIPKIIFPKKASFA